MSYGQLIRAGELNVGDTLTITDRTTCWMVVQHLSNSEIIATFDDEYAVHLSKDLTDYVKIPGSYQKLAVTGHGSLHYMIFG
jgi:hypothetical protein